MYFAISDIILFDPCSTHLHYDAHADPGWLKTVDEYYTGANATVYSANVELIFDTVLNELIENPERTYSFCEISYFSRWWHEQTDKKREQVKRLVTETKQLVFLNGGWVMHDEAGSHYVSMIDQTTLGHTFLADAFDGYTPKVGWQIDPFGHSNTHAWLSDEFGFDSLFFGRIDYQDMMKRKAEKNLEFIWKGSQSLPEAQVFTGVFSSGNYGPPAGFCFDTICTWCSDDPIVNDEKLETYNLDVRVDAFLEALEEEAFLSRGKTLMMKMGTDFTWSNAKSWFNSVDRLIEGVNAKQSKFNLFWSNPERYTLARAAELGQSKDLSFSTKTDDLMPYADCAHCYWSGYFTSRPTIKYFERTSSSFLQTLRQSFAAAEQRGLIDQMTREEMTKVESALVAAVGLLNHHDAITGTEKQHVAYDYVKILAKAQTAAEVTLAKLATLGTKFPDLQAEVCRMAKNESTCTTTQSLSPGDSASILVYNALPRQRTQFVDLFLSGDSSDSNTPPTATVQLNEEFISAEVIATTPGSIKANANAAPWTIRFEAKNVPALSSVTYKLTVQDWVELDQERIHANPAMVKNDGVDLQISNSHVSVVFDSVTGVMKNIIRHIDTNDHSDDIVANIENELGYYISFGSPGAPGYKYPLHDHRDPHVQNMQPSASAADRDASTQPSGAYLFRPHTENELPECITSDSSARHTARAKSISADSCDRSAYPVQLSVIHGKKFSEVRQVFSDWAVQTVRIYDNDPSVEVEWTVGPIPIEDNLGKEVVSKFAASNFNTGPEGENSVWTDSNGREFQHRILNYRPTWDLEVHEPVAGNFYPITTAMYIKGDMQQASGEIKRAQLSVLVDRAQAGASLRSGEMEFMVHRRLLADDHRGVGEALNETTGGISPYPDWIRSGDGIIVSGKHRVLLSQESHGMKDLRKLIDEVYSPLTVVNQKIASGLVETPVLSLGLGLGYDLPINVHLLTLVAKDKDTLFIRLAHQFAVNEDKQLSDSVSVDLGLLLKPYRVVPGTLQEWTLSHNQLKKNQVQNKIDWSSIDNISHEVDADLYEKTLVVTLRPMQIKSYTVKIESSN